jgi:8-hydroxy-5-deazaflavin:NADPH oxidoreductase
MSTTFLAPSQWRRCHAGVSFAPSTKNMQTPQTRVIIGAGKMGKAIAAGLATGHDRVILCDGNHQKAETVATDLKATHPHYNLETVVCSYEATWEADVIILSFPSCPDKQELVRKIKPVANQKIVVTVDADAGELKELLPHSKIVQAFTGITENDFLMPFKERINIPCPIISNDEEAIDTLAGLVQTIGFKPRITVTP